MSMRCLQGNCSGDDAAAELGLSAGEAAELLPLRPRQCLVVVDDTMLMVLRGTLWLHNLYLKLGQKHRRNVEMSFIAVGMPAQGDAEFRGVMRSDTYATSVTFHSQPFHRSTAISINEFYSSIYLTGAILNGREDMSIADCCCHHSRTHWCSFNRLWCTPEAATPA